MHNKVFTGENTTAHMSEPQEPFTRMDTTLCNTDTDSRGRWPVLSGGPPGWGRRWDPPERSLAQLVCP